VTHGRWARTRWPATVLLLTILSGGLLCAVGVAPAGATPSSPGVRTAVTHLAPGHATPRTDPATPGELSAAQQQAEQLRQTLVVLAGREDRAQERLGLVRDELADLSVRAVSTEQQLQQLDAAATVADDDAVNRVRALYMTGGLPALYASVLGGSDISDVLSRVTTLRQVVATDTRRRASAAEAVQRTEQLHTRLAAAASRRAQLAGRAAALLDQVQRVQQARRDAMRQATAQVKQLQARLAQQREAAAREAAAAQLASAGLTTGPRAPAGNPYGDAAIAAALSKLGRPYVWGAEGPDTFDCSGLVQWSYAQAGLALPRLADDQFFAGVRVPVSDLRPGDLLVYAYDVHDAGTIHHITMYIGNGQMVEAPHTGAVVRVGPVSFDGLYGASRPGLG
jgi:cell wall-associated NlpC family hydrolase